MKEDIISKLTTLCNGNINSESEVLYFLTELRKLMERDLKKSQYPTLDFYANWVVHPKLDRNIEAQRVLSMVNDKVAEYRSTNDAGAFYSCISELLSFKNLYIEIHNLFKHYLVPYAFTEESFARFRLYLIAIISDCPLQVLDKEKPNKLVYEFSVSSEHSLVSRFETSNYVWLISIANSRPILGPIAEYTRHTLGADYYQQ